MEFMLNTSRQLANLHKQPQDANITNELSLAVLNSCGRLILQEIFCLEQAMCWLGHDVIARDLAKRNK